MMMLRQALVRSVAAFPPKAAATTGGPMLIRRQATSAAGKVNFFEKNARLGRPMSPHLTIYAPQLTSVLSVSHRITGVAWYFALGIPSILIPASGMKWDDVMKTIRGFNINRVLIQSAKFFVIFPFTYHSFNGVRHLVWDSGRALTLEGVYAGGKATVAAAAVTAVALTAAK